jgi:hypothetical protein
LFIEDFLGRGLTAFWEISEQNVGIYSGTGSVPRSGKFKRFSDPARLIKLFRTWTLNTANEIFQFEAARRFEDTGYFYLHLTTSPTHTFLGQSDAHFIKSNYDWLLLLGTIRVVQNVRTGSG